MTAAAASADNAAADNAADDNAAADNATAAADNTAADNATAAARWQPEMNPLACLASPIHCPCCRRHPPAKHCPYYCTYSQITKPLLKYTTSAVTATQILDETGIEELEKSDSTRIILVMCWFSINTHHSSTG